jgi:hypothetical protein
MSRLLPRTIEIKSGTSTGGTLALNSSQSLNTIGRGGSGSITPDGGEKSAKIILYGATGNKLIDPVNSFTSVVNAGCAISTISINFFSTPSGTIVWALQPPSKSSFTVGATIQKMHLTYYCDSTLALSTMKSFDLVWGESDASSSLADGGGLLKQKVNNFNYYGPGISAIVSGSAYTTYTDGTGLIASYTSPQTTIRRCFLSQTNLTTTNFLVNEFHFDFTNLDERFTFSNSRQALWMITSTAGFTTTDHLSGYIEWAEQ